MKKGTLRAWAVVCGVIAVVALVAGLFLHSQAAFADQYVHDQLAAQKITFLPKEALTPEQQAIPCLTANAGQPLTSGTQAECYANQQIGVDLKQVAGGKTYAEVSYPAKLARDKATAALKADPTSAETKQLVSQADQLDIPVGVMFRGETLRGLLLTTYGFSLLGERAAQGATVAFVLGGVLLVAALALVAASARARRAEPGMPTPAPMPSNGDRRLVGTGAP